MFRKFMLLMTALMLVAAWLVLSPSSARAGRLAESTPTPDQMGSAPLDANGATVKILSPANGATLHDTSVLVKVQTTNLPLGTNGAHFHLYVDGKVQGMSEGSSNSLMAHDLTPGDHELQVVLANGLHQELNAPDQIKINVQLPTTTATSPDNSAALAIGLVAAAVIVGGVGFAVSRRK